MIDFEIQKFSRRCASTGRELAPGEAFYSVLVAEGAEVIRLDYSTESWSGAPDDAVGWWKSEVPDPKSNRLQWAPNDVMLHYFQQILAQDNKKEVCYVLTLLMIRRRIFKMEATERDAQGRDPCSEARCRSACRGALSPGERSYGVGFRLVRTP